jgi:hypothetical protein
MTCCFAWIWNLLSHVKEGDSLRVSENRPLRRILGSVDRRLKNFHKMQGLIFTLVSILLGYQIKEGEKGGACSTHGQTRNAYVIVVMERLIGRPRCR